MKFGRARMSCIVAMLLAAFATAPQAQQAGRKEHTFRGKIEKVDEKAKTLTVNGENVEGWMPAMTMTYALDKEETIKKVKVGDQITAKVYDGDFKVLHDVEVVPPKAKK
jgi:Cu/Ag efflux protein CusF